MHRRKRVLYSLASILTMAPNNGRIFNLSIHDSSSPPWMEFIGAAAAAESSSKPWQERWKELQERLDFYGCLHEEIYALLLWLEPTPEELYLRQRVLARVTIVATTIWPECRVSSFGSYYTGLWLPNGDIDICIMGVPGDQVANLRILTLCLGNFGLASAVEIISSARVPIVKFIDSETGVPIDISLNTDSAISTSEFVVQQMKIYPWLRPLILIIKLYLQQRGLGETYRGGVGSYLLFVLCLSFLQQHKLIRVPNMAKSLGLGHLLLDFFKLYGRDFNIETTGISVRHGGRYFSKIDRQWYASEKSGLLAVESPLDGSVDLGRNSYDIRTVRTCFRQSFLTLLEELHDNKKDNNNDSILKLIIFTDDPLMKRRFKKIETTPLKSSSWWKEVSILFNKPVAAIRPIPVLPKLIIEQIREDLDLSVKKMRLRKITTSLFGSKISNKLDYKSKIKKKVKDLIKDDQIIDISEFTSKKSNIEEWD